MNRYTALAIAGLQLSSQISLAADDRALRQRIINGSAAVQNLDLLFHSGETALKEYRFRDAERCFSEVLAAQPGPNNPHYREAGDYIGPEKDLLFKRKLEHYTIIIDNNIAAIANLRQAARETANADEKQRLEGLIGELILKTNNYIDEICSDSKRRGRDCRWNRQ